MKEGDLLNKKLTDTPTISNLIGKKIIVVGVSSGGPQVLAKILSKISNNFPFPILIVQHISKGFLSGMVDWLNRILDIDINIAQNNQKIYGGNVYFAPDNYQMGVKYGRIYLKKQIPNETICPSVSYLFNNIYDIKSTDIIAMILTGMGKDGADEIKKLRLSGAVTIAQDSKTSLIYGMPREAVKLGGIDYILSDRKIAMMLCEIEKEYVKQKI